MTYFIDISPLDGYPDILKPGVDELDALHSDAFASLLPDLTSLEFSAGFFSEMDTGSIFMLGSPHSRGYVSVPTIQTEATQRASSNGQKCSQEAYDILSSLRSLSTAQSTSQSSPNSTSAMANTPDQVSFDHVLRVNREASERLGQLLSYPCAGSTDLVLLYASVISQVLVWYQQAAGCTQSALGNPATMTLDTASQNVDLSDSSPSSGSGSAGESSAWSSTAASAVSSGGATGTLTLTHPTGLDVAAGKIAIGSYIVDDLRVQSALKIQLLLGEMRRAGRLIDQFTSHNTSGQCLFDENAIGGVHTLYRSLDLWLRGEHSRIVNLMRANLGVLNT